MSSEEKIDVLNKALTLLRQFGWEIGYPKLEDWLPKTEEEPVRSIHALFLGGRAWESGRYLEAEQQFQTVKEPELQAWALAGLGFCAERQRRFESAQDYFDQAETVAEKEDRNVRAIIAHGRGTNEYHRGNDPEARRFLGEALALLTEPQSHFLTPRIYDTLGMTWSVTGNFYAASEMYTKALELKEGRAQKERDVPGIALTRGQLGRLYLDWGLLDQAETHFKADLRIVKGIDDRRSEAQMYNFLGIIEIRRSERARARGPRHIAENALKKAIDYLHDSIKLADQNPAWTVQQGYARKDRALVALALGQLDRAEDDLSQAEQLFQTLSFFEGLAHVDRARGILMRLRNEPQESLRLLQKALHFFQDNLVAEQARAELEIARTREAAGDSESVVVLEYVRALDTAESCRRPMLVQEIESELERVSQLEMSQRNYQRVRGRNVREATTSLVDAKSEAGSVLYLDIQGSTAFAHHRAPEEVMLIINQLMADLSAILRTHEGQVSGFRGDGFLALFRGPNCAVRAVSAALDLIAQVHEFNEPRRFLGEREFVVRTGVATGGLCFGNVGSYDKMDFTAIGTPANLGARLESQAIPEEGKSCCICHETYNSIGDRFQYSEDSPRNKNLKGLGEQSFWFVVGQSTDPADDSSSN